MQVVQYSKYEWCDSFISENNVDSIVKQLKDGNIYVLNDDQFYVFAQPGDLRIKVGYYRDEIDKLHYHKVTNDTRRLIIKSYKIKSIVDQDNEKCVSCGSIDCSTCMQFSKNKSEKRTNFGSPTQAAGTSRTSYIVICHSCGYKSIFK